MSTWFRLYGLAEVADNLLIGAYPLDGEDVLTLEGLGVRRILNLVEDREYALGEREDIEAALRSAKIEEMRLSVPDYGDFSEAELEAAARQVSEWLDEDLRTYIHCRAGWQRSAVVAAAALALQEDIDVGVALALIQQRKPSADPLPHQRADLRAWWERRRG